MPTMKSCLWPQTRRVGATAHRAHGFSLLSTMDGKIPQKLHSHSPESTESPLRFLYAQVWPVSRLLFGPSKLPEPGAPPLGRMRQASSSQKFAVPPSCANLTYPFLVGTHLSKN